MGPGANGMKYLLVIKDDLSSFICLVPTKSATAEHAANAVAGWIRTFIAMNTWVSDQGTYFKNDVLKRHASDYRILHHFPIAHSPWANGTVEAVNRNVLAACRALTTEIKLTPQDWPEIAFLLTSVINEAPTLRPGKRKYGLARSPLEVMTGLRLRRAVLRSPDATITSPSFEIDRIRAEQLVEVEKLLTTITEMHKHTGEAVSNNLLKQLRAHNKKTNIIQPNFSPGDFVLVCRAQKEGHKLSFRWIGPRRILETTSELVYNVAKLNVSGVEQIHAACPQLYRAIAENAEVLKDLLQLTDRTEARYELI